MGPPEEQLPDSRRVRFNRIGMDVAMGGLAITLAVRVETWLEPADTSLVPIVEWSGLGVAGLSLLAMGGAAAYQRLRNGPSAPNHVPDEWPPEGRGP